MGVTEDIGMFWDEEAEGYGGLALDDLQGNNSLESGNQSINGGGLQSSEDSGCRSIVVSPVFNMQQEMVAPSSPLGLTLRKTPSLVSLLEMRLSAQQQAVLPTQDNHGSDHDRPRRRMENVGSQPLSEKLKASNFPIISIKIGAWQRSSRHEGDLIAKMYYAKRKIVWEVLDGPLKKTNPQPRKHTNWQQAPDFTEGQAPIWRIHCVSFPPGVLDKHYEKLLQCDQQLFVLSQKPFPSQESPYFHSATSNFNGLGSRFLPVVQYRYPPYPTTARGVSIRPTPNPVTAMDFQARNSQLVPQRQTIWGDQGVNFPRGNINTQGPSVFASLAPGNQVLSCHNYHSNVVVALNDIENHLLGDSQVVCTDEGTLLAQMQSMDSLLNPNNNPNHYQTTGSSTDQVMQNSTDNMHILDGHYSHPVNLSNDSITMEPEVENFISNLADGDPYC
ncbi:hypothetical protein Pfo_005163 [Paulownia fortunei]|nr:hypothetical protein Pfo_005163 [Paulownia fortunei]